MKCSEKVRVLVFSLFLSALIVFALAYRPTSAVSLSHPSDQTNVAGVHGNPGN